MSNTQQERFTAKDVVRHLRLHFASPAFAFLEQVADGTGAQQHRWADAVAMSVWPSRGYEVHGVEVKVSRNDWQKELAQPEKSAAVQQYCNRWWIATSDDTIIKPGELPPTWGWMVVKKDKGMRVITPAPTLTPQPLTMEFVASVFRNYGKTEEAVIEKRIRKACDEAQEKSSGYYERKYNELHKSVEEFEAASGISLKYAWDAGLIGEQVETLMNLSHRVEQIKGAIESCESIRSMLQKVETFATLKSQIKETAA